jgi:uncharacterized protein YggU (UPF0235/DUF167 family)
MNEEAIMSADSKKYPTKLPDGKGGAAFAVQVVTKTVKTELVGPQQDGTIKIRLMASPAGSNEANKELVNFLSKLLEVPVEKIEIVAGENKRDKIVSIEGFSATEVEAKLGV